MAELNKSYRIRTKISDGENVESPVINVHLDQTYDMLEILSLKLNTSEAYRHYESEYGVVVGRVVANGNFGIPNAKISIFIPVDETTTLRQRLNYNYYNITDTDKSNVRYNVLPDASDDACKQVVGTFPNKRLVLDNDDIIEVYDKYWKYTTTTNSAGDYMLFGVPTGSQQLHVDIDLSDCGVLSQRPRDLVYKGYNINLFESPNKFKKSSNLDSLVQIYSQNRGVYVYPYWGEQTDFSDNLAITRCDIQIEYKFEPTCVFMGSIITDKGGNAIGKNCTASKKLGRMSDLITGEGTIEMIRKTPTGTVEQFQIKGDRLIDSEGVWCYQIPMNLDYVMTDEFGNLVPTDDPDKGIPTRTRVRFRISLDDSINDTTAVKKCRYLVPNNPKFDEKDYPKFCETGEADYEFGTNTREESYRDLLWNKVYTVKNYIPRLQKNSHTTNQKFTGIKWTNHAGDNNPMPYNALSIKLSFMYRLICVLTKVIIYVIVFFNTILGVLLTPICAICKLLRGLGKIPFVGFVFKGLAKLFCSMVFSCIKLSSEFCDDGINRKTYYPGCMGCQRSETQKKHNDEQAKIARTNPDDVTTADWTPSLSHWEDSTLFTCVENSLAQENDATSFVFQNDWVNGVLYAPSWYRRITPKKSFLFGLFKRKAKDQWCNSDGVFGLQLFQGCALERSNASNVQSHLTGESVEFKKVTRGNQCSNKKCHDKRFLMSYNNGLILTRQTMLGQTVYYYKALEVDTLGVAKKEKSPMGNTYNAAKTLFATDIVLLGSLNDCDINGIPQFFKHLSSSTYNMPSDILFTDTTIKISDTGEGVYELSSSTLTEATGCDWGNLNTFDECGKMNKNEDGGLFYGIGCNSIEMKDKSCLNLSRICEFGVGLDTSKFITDLNKLGGGNLDEDQKNYLRPDGFISFDELYNVDERSMFATLNGNNLRTTLNKENGLREYDFHYLYVDNFDGSLASQMAIDLAGCNKTYGKNNAYEYESHDYYMFRMGGVPYFYDDLGQMPRYDNSFYFYFGLKNGKTAIEKFNSQFFASCEDVSGETFQAAIDAVPNDWCSELSKDTKDMNGYVTFSFDNIAMPYDMIINSTTDVSYGYEIHNINSEKIYIGNNNDNVDKKGYKNVKIFNNNYVITLLNDEYEVIVTDAEGTITFSKFSMMPKLLTFKTESHKFAMSNNQKFKLYNSYDKVVTDHSYKNITSYVNSFTKSEIVDEGGFIVIDNLRNDNKVETAIKIIVEPYDIETDFNDYRDKWYGCIIDELIVKLNGNNSTLTRSNKSTDTDNKTYLLKENKLYIAVPKGDVIYKVTINELCGGVESSNVVTSSIMVEDPVPFKLFVNDVDIDIFDKNKFDIGWSFNNKGEVTQGNISNLNGWTNLSNEDNYNWDELTEYQKAKNQAEVVLSNSVLTIEDTIKEFNSDSDSNTIKQQLTNLKVSIKQQNKLSDKNIIVNHKQNIEDTINELKVKLNDANNSLDENTTQLISEIILPSLEGMKESLSSLEELKSEYINKIKSSFQITCPTDLKTIMLSVSTNNYPVKYKIVHSQEEISQEELSLNILTDSSQTIEEIDSVNDIGIPTLTSTFNTKYGYYGNDTKYKTNTEPVSICFGYDNYTNNNTKKYNTKWFKKPYFVAIQDARNNMKPSELSTNDFENSKANKFFGFHLIDKIFSMDFVAWAYLNGIPYYKPTNQNYNGVAVSMMGVFSGKVYNGIIRSDVEVSNVFNSYDIFDLQTIENDKIGILTKNEIDIPNNTEDAIPTIRDVIHITSVNKTIRNLTEINDNIIEYVNRTVLEIINDYKSIQTKINQYKQGSSLQLAIESLNDVHVKLNIIGNSGSVTNELIQIYNNVTNLDTKNEINAIINSLKKADEVISDIDYINSILVNIHDSNTIDDNTKSHFEYIINTLELKLLVSNDIDNIMAVLTYINTNLNNPDIDTVIDKLIIISDNLQTMENSVSNLRNICEGLSDAEIKKLIQNVINKLEGTILTPDNINNSIQKLNNFIDNNEIEGLLDKCNISLGRLINILDQNCSVTTAIVTSNEKIENVSFMIKQQLNIITNVIDKLKNVYVDISTQNVVQRITTIITNLNNHELTISNIDNAKTALNEISNDIVEDNVKIALNPISNNLDNVKPDIQNLNNVNTVITDLNRDNLTESNIVTINTTLSNVMYNKVDGNIKSQLQQVINKLNGVKNKIGIISKVESAIDDLNGFLLFITQNYIDNAKEKLENIYNTIPKVLNDETLSKINDVINILNIHDVSSDKIEEAKGILNEVCVDIKNEYRNDINNDAQPLLNNICEQIKSQIRIKIVIIQNKLYDVCNKIKDNIKDSRKNISDVVNQTYLGIETPITEIIFNLEKLYDLSIEENKIQDVITKINSLLLNELETMDSKYIVERNLIDNDENGIIAVLKIIYDNIDSDDIKEEIKVFLNSLTNCYGISYKRLIRNGNNIKGFLEIPNKNVDISIEDTSCFINETIYGRLKLNLLGDSINDCNSQKNNILKFNLLNGDSNDDCTYYIIKHIKDNKSDNYPINNITYDEDQNMFRFENDFGIMAHDVSELDINNHTHGDVKGEEIDNNDNKIKLDGYSKTGLFYNIKNGEQYYVIGVTANGCRTISPIYDFSDVKVNVKVTEVDGMYLAQLQLADKNIPYYLQHFGFIYDIEINSGDTLIEQSIEVEKEETLSIKIENAISYSNTELDKSKTYVYCSPEKQYITYAYSNECVTSEISVEIEGSDRTDYEQIFKENYNNPYGYPNNDEYQYLETQLCWFEINGSNYVWELKCGTGGIYTCEKVLKDDTKHNNDNCKGNESKLHVFSYLNTNENVYTYQVIEKFDGWIILSNSDVDTSLEHYKKYVNVQITKNIYNMLKSVVRNKFLQENVKINVTDCTGLKHSVIKSI